MLRHLRGTYCFTPEPLQPRSDNVEPGSPRAKKVQDMHSSVFTIGSDKLSKPMVHQMKQRLLQGSEDMKSPRTCVPLFRQFRRMHWC